MQEWCWGPEIKSQRGLSYKMQEGQQQVTYVSLQDTYKPSNKTDALKAKVLLSV